MANNQENEDFSQDVKDEQQLNGEKLAAGENGTDNGSEQLNGQNEESIGENGGQSNEVAARDDDRLVRTFHTRIAFNTFYHLYTNMIHIIYTHPTANEMFNTKMKKKICITRASRKKSNFACGNFRST